MILRHGASFSSRKLSASQYLLPSRPNLQQLHHSTAPFLRFHGVRLYQDPPTRGVALAVQISEQREPNQNELENSSTGHMMAKLHQRRKLEQPEQSVS